MSKRLTEAQKRRRRWARQSGQSAADSILLAVRYQLDAHWSAARPAYADLAKQWQQLSDKAIDNAVYNARYAAHWARLSEEGSL